MNSVNDICKESLTVLSYFEKNLIEKIPSKVFKALNELAADSKKDFYIDNTKDFSEQNITEECKDLISLIYYSYIIKQEEKADLLELWNRNEKQYQEELKEKYKLDKIFKNKESI